MRVTVNIGVCVMFAVDSHPLAWSDTSSDPHSNSKEESSGLTQRECTVAQAAMQIHGGARVGDYRDGKSDDGSNDEGVYKPIHLGIIVCYLLVGRH